MNLFNKDMLLHIFVPLLIVFYFRKELWALFGVKPTINEGFFFFNKDKQNEDTEEDFQEEEDLDDEREGGVTRVNANTEVIRGSVGPRGFRGSIGPPGPRGQRGDKGDQGDRGPRGEMGPRGYTGKGEKGEKGDRGHQGLPGQQGDPGTFAENSCKFFGSNSESQWACPETYPIYSGASMGSGDNMMKCNGGVARNARCGKEEQVTQQVGIGGQGMAVVTNGQIGRILVINKGKGYYLPPKIQVLGGGGSGVKAIPEIQNGQLTNIKILNPGSGFTDTPIIKIESDTVTNGCNYCHMCCKKPAIPSVLKPGQPGYIPPIDLQIQQNKEKIDELNKKIDTLQSCPKGVSDSLSRLERATGMRSLDEDEEQTDKKVSEMYKRRAANEYKQLKNELNTLGGEDNLDSPMADIDGADPRILKAERNWAAGEKSIEPFQSSLEVEDVAVARQSSTYKNRDASYAIDNDTDSYSQTKFQKNAWFEVKLPNSVEIDRINIYNRKGNKEVKERLVPFRVTVFNTSGSIVGSKDYNMVSNVYRWKNVNLVGRMVRIQLLKEDYLHIRNIEVVGVKSNTCVNYQTISNELETMKGVGGTFFGRKLNPSQVKRLFDKYSSLYTSCKKLPVREEKTRKQDIERKARLFEEYLEDEMRIRRIRVGKAKRLLQKIRVQEAKEAKINGMAKKYNLDTPRPLYQPEFVRRIEEEANIQEIESPMKKYGPEKRARCYDILQLYKLKKTDQERRIRNVGNDPDVIHEFDRKKLETIKKIFEKECGKFPDGKFANSAGTPARQGQPSDFEDAMDF